MKLKAESFILYRSEGEDVSYGNMPLVTTISRRDSKIVTLHDSFQPQDGKDSIIYSNWSADLPFQKMLDLMKQTFEGIKDYTKKTEIIHGYWPKDKGPSETNVPVQDFLYNGNPLERMGEKDNYLSLDNPIAYLMFNSTKPITEGGIVEVHFDAKFNLEEMLVDLLIKTEMLPKSEKEDLRVFTKRFFGTYKLPQVNNSN